MQRASTRNVLEPSTQSQSPDWLFFVSLDIDAKYSYTFLNVKYVRKVLMKTKHIVVEFLPRVLWIIEGIALYTTHRWVNGYFQITQNAGLRILGTSLLLLGIPLLIWSFRLLAKAMFTKQLTTNGLYSVMRHPMYTSIYLVLMGIGSWFESGIWFIVLLGFCPLWYWVARAEEMQMREITNGAYATYAKNVGMFIPKV